MFVKFAIQKDANEISHWGVCSLCKTSDNVCLWENYAGENGICIELDVLQLDLLIWIDTVEIDTIQFLLIFL